MRALIDGDIVVYQAVTKAQEKVDWGNGEVVSWADAAAAERLIDVLIHDIKREVGATKALLVFTDDTANFRKDVYPAYKRNRIDKVKPLLLDPCKEYVREKYPTMRRPYLEADDVLGIVATAKIKGLEGPRVVCSIDKDMRTFPCSLYDWRAPELGVQTITESEADFAFYCQILTGDSTDGYPGVPGIGKVKAARVLETFVTDVGFDNVGAWEAIIDEYARKGLTAEDAIVQARCARILRAEDYNFKTKRPKLWKPPAKKTRRKTRVTSRNRPGQD
jgi:DNA polymerase-1